MTRRSSYPILHRDKVEERSACRGTLQFRRVRNQVRHGTQAATKSAWCETDNAIKLPAGVCATDLFQLTIQTAALIESPDADGIRLIPATDGRSGLETHSVGGFNDID